jgi:hypothetical protein
MVPSTVVFGATAVAIGNDPDAPSISKVLGGRPFHRSGWLFREFLKAFTLGFGQQEDCDDQTQDAYKATNLAHGRSDTMTGGSNLYRKDLSRLDESSSVWPKLGKEVAESVNN